MKSGRCSRCRFAIPVYMGDGDELLTACVYILRAGRKRPCPPGEGCGVFEPAEADRGAAPAKMFFGKGLHI